MGQLEVRQYGKVLGDIRPDHVRRYLFAETIIPPGSKVLDAACGIGYGSWMLSQRSDRVTGVDISQHAIDWANKYWSGPLYVCGDLEQIDFETYDAIISFETLEHLPIPEDVLDKFRKSTKRLICSVPNEDLYHYNPERFANDEYPHLRHYTPGQFDQLLADAGFTVVRRCCQKSKWSDVEEGTDGMFLIYVCE